MAENLFDQFDNGTVTIAGKRIETSGLAWNPHKDFTGVSLKNVVTADQTSGLFTCHLVRIEPLHKIGLHTHPASIELHEVIAGSGVCLMEQEEIPYAPGTVTLIACTAPHEVRAGKDGLYLFAKFIAVPA